MCLPVLVMSTSELSAKRAAPAEILPVTVGGMVVQPFYEQAPRVGCQVFLIAQQLKDNKIVWKTLLYSVNYNQSLETDVQDIFLKSLTVEGQTIKAIDERERQYRVDLKTGRKR